MDEHFVTRSTRIHRRFLMEQNYKNYEDSSRDIPMQNRGALASYTRVSALNQSKFRCL